MTRDLMGENLKKWEWLRNDSESVTEVIIDLCETLRYHNKKYNILHDEQKKNNVFFC